MTWRIFVKNLIYPGTLWGPLFPLKLAKFRRGVFSSFFQLSRSSYLPNDQTHMAHPGLKSSSNCSESFLMSHHWIFLGCHKQTKYWKMITAINVSNSWNVFPHLLKCSKMLLREKWKKNKKPKIKFLAPPQCQFDIRMSKLFHLSEFRISFERIWLPGVDIVGVGIVEFEILIKMLALGGWKTPSAQLVISGTNI